MSKQFDSTKNFNSNMLTVVNSLGSMNKALERFADYPRPSKRQKRDELSDSDTNSNNEANNSDVYSAASGGLRATIAKHAGRN